MANIIKFPKVFRESAKVTQATPRPAAKAPSVVKRNRFISGLDTIVWIVVAVISPLLEKVLSIDVFFQFIRMMYYWNTPAVHAGWTFLLHFGVLNALICYVAFYKPKGL